MSSRHGRAYFQLTAKQTTNLAATNSSTLRAFPIFLPDVSEQRRILSAIDADTSNQDSALSDTRREIALLMEYRTRLIADIVTGKLDVREAAMGLPDSAEEPERQEEIELDVDSEQADEDIDAVAAEVEL